MKMSQVALKHTTELLTAFFSGTLTSAQKLYIADIIAQAADSELTAALMMGENLSCEPSEEELAEAMSNAFYDQVMDHVNSLV